MLPTPYTLGVKRYTPGAADSHGNASPSWSAPNQWLVSAIAPGAMSEPAQSNRDLSLVLYTIYAPPSPDVPGVRDRVVFDLDDPDASVYEVEGEPEDWTRGPWSFEGAGVAVQLRKADG